ncbi:hypothetical protein GCM10018952_04080 [Streptosporangium vulgare]
MGRSGARAPDVVDEPSEPRVVQVPYGLRELVGRLGLVVEVGVGRLLLEQSVVHGEPERPGQVGHDQVEPDPGGESPVVDAEVGAGQPDGEVGVVVGLGRDVAQLEGGVVVPGELVVDDPDLGAAADEVLRQQVVVARHRGQRIGGERPFDLRRRGKAVPVAVGCGQFVGTAQGEELVQLAEDGEVVDEPGPGVQPPAGRRDGAGDRPHGVGVQGDAVEILQDQRARQPVQHPGADPRVRRVERVGDLLVERYAQAGLRDPGIQHAQQPSPTVGRGETGDPVAEPTLDQSLGHGLVSPFTDVR